MDLDKTIRDTIASEGLTTRVITYAAEDVKYLELIRDSQKKEKNLVVSDLCSDDGCF